ncbi:UNVERIFIED_CONTAM: hypothetical protein GTU68_026501 [Idotea baltica]|nr:hypothetical protein [Idotea baltica]
MAPQSMTAASFASI